MDKPTGKIGPFKITVGTNGTSVQSNYIQWPKIKDEIELLIVSIFIKSSPPGLVINSPIQNEENDFDFSIGTNFGKKTLELMEIAPCEYLVSGYARAPNQFDSKIFSKILEQKIQAKIDKYGIAGNLVLLLYITDFKFLLPPQVIEYIQYWMNTKQHCFELVYYIAPVEAEFGFVEKIFPLERDWNDYNSDQSISFINLDVENAQKLQNGIQFNL